VIKAGAQRYAVEHGIAILAPDTSPRGEQVADGAEGEWDLGQGAGFYLNATQSPWSEHYRMYDYIVDELPELVSVMPELDTQKVSLAGHSMGGHGALVIGLRNPERFRSVSAFAPMCSPSHSEFGNKALSQYLGADQSAWADYDATLLLAGSSPQLPILVDQGEEDEFLHNNLRPDLLIEAAEATEYPMQVRFHPEYDHSYFFVASFFADHMEFHAGFLFD